MSQNKINDNISSAVFWLGTKGQKNIKKDHLLFFTEWLEKHEGVIANMKSKDEKDLTVEEITEFAELQTTIYHSLVGSDVALPMSSLKATSRSDLLDTLRNID